MPLAVILVAAAAPRGASADIQLSGRWLVRHHYGFLFNFTEQEDWGFDGRNVFATCVPGTCNGDCGLPCESGLANPFSGQLYLFKSIDACGDPPLQGSASADGRTFTATGFLGLPGFPGMPCRFGVPVEVTGSRCGNGILDVGEVCDDGNDVNGDGCDSCASVCGNGIPEGLEQCDDGNADDHDACKSDCTANVCGDGVVRTGVEACDGGLPGTCLPSCQFGLIAGGGLRGDDRLHEWSTQPASPFPPLVRGLRDGFACTDDDPSCDFGAVTNDNACTFHIGMCFNIRYSRNSFFDIITAPPIRSVQIVSPSAAARPGADAQNRDALEQALHALGGHVQGVCLRGPHRGQFCSANTHCDSAVGSADGLCPRTHVFAPLVGGTDRCTPLAEIRVPRRPGRRGVKTLALQAFAANDATTGRPGAVDRDRLRLICLPP